MVRYGPRPPHRRGTSGSRWRRFRAAHTDHATHCQNPACGKPLVRDAPCPPYDPAHPQAHRNHRGLGYCPTHHAYPTLEHPHHLVDGGNPRDPSNALVYCYQCNARGGRAGRGRQAPTPTTSRAW